MIIEITTAPSEDEIDAQARRSIVEFVGRTLGGNVDFLHTEALSDWDGQGFERYTKKLARFMPTSMAKTVVARVQNRIGK